MSEIILVEQLAEQMHVSADIAMKHCRDAGLKSANLVISGKSLMAFDKVQAVKAIDDAIKNDAAEKAKKITAQKVEPSLSQQVLKLLETVQSTIENVAYEVDAIKKQGPSLLKAIEIVRSEMNSGIGKLMFAMEQLNIHKTTHEEVTPPKPEKPVKNLCVIAGIHPSEQEIVRREFSEMLELHMFSPSESEGSKFENLLNRSKFAYMNSNILTKDVRRKIMDIFPAVETFRGMSGLKELMTVAALE